MLYFFDGSEQKLSQKVIIPEKGVGVILIVVSHLNAKKMAMKFINYKADAKVIT